VATRPLCCGWELLCETGEHFWAMAEGGLAKRLLPLRGQPGPLRKHHHPPQDQDLETCLRDLTGQDLEPTRVRLAVEGHEALAALYEAIDSAAERIDVLMFYWENDAVGEAIAARLAAKAGPRVRVRVLIDGGGNLVFGLPHHTSAAQVNRVLAILASNPYVEVIRIRNPFLRFDHRKLVLVDGRWAWSGGRNFAHEAFFDNHDLSFVFDGPLVARLQERYESYWRHQGGAPSEPPAPVAPAACDPCRAAAPGQGRVIVSEPGQRQLAQALYLAIDRAQERVFLQNVYFSDSRLIIRLAEARRRGVDVRVVLTVASESDTINRANKVLANRLLQAGVRVFLYPGKTHVKAALVDGLWAYIGTGNFDALSLRHNYEFGLSLGPGPALDELERRLFAPDFQAGRELTEPVPLTPQDYLSELLASVFL
jgi:cardiolipin synthase